MVSNQMNTAGLIRALKESGITNPADRRALIKGRGLKEKIVQILENNPGLQEELAQTMGIGDVIIGHLHEVMEKDFQEPSTLLRWLMEFFQTHGKVHMNIYEVTDTSIRSFHATDKERVHDVHSLFASSNGKDFINEKAILNSEDEESCQIIEGIGGNLCIKIVTITWTRLVLSFGDKSTPKNEIAKIQKLLKKTGLAQHIRQKLKHIQVKYTDHLTGLYNKHYIQSIVEQNIPYSVVFLDLDKFKEYNDTHGHSAWDTLLQDIAKILESSVRYNDKVCRNGWDEFIIFIDGCDAHKEVDKIRERIKEKVDIFNISRQQATDSSPISITSWYATWDTGDTLEDIIRRADKEMYKSKIEQWSKWGTYRIVNEVSELPDTQQKEVIAGIIAVNVDVVNYDENFRCPLKNQICKRPVKMGKKNS